MKRKVLIALGFLSFLAFALQAKEDRDISRVFNQTGKGDMENTNRGAGLSYSKKRREKSSVYNFPEIVYEHLKFHEKEPIKTAVAQKVDAAFNVAEYEKKKQEELRKKMEKKVQESIKKQNALKYFFAEGYCKVSNDIKVDKLATYAYLQCDLDPLGKSELTVSLVPDFYSGALIAQPLYVSAEIDGRKIKIPVKSGAVLNATKTSINVASIVNDKKVKKYLAALGINSANIVTQKAQEYLEAKREASRQESVSVAGTGQNTTIIKATQTQPPKKSDYISTAAVMVLSEVAKALGNFTLDSLDYTFFVKKGTVLYADLMLSLPPYLRGYIIENGSLTVKQPTFDVGNYKENRQAIPIRIDRSR